MKTSYTLGVLSVLSLALLASPALALAKRHHWQKSITQAPVALLSVSGSVSTPLNTSLTNTNKHKSKTPPPVTSTSTPIINPPTIGLPIIVPLSLVASSAGEVRISAYTTAYGWPDNTPAGNAISNSVLHNGAGGTGTFVDPITMAVGHTITGGKDILDYPAGTKFYVPNLRRYFIVEDTCGDGNQPQNGPCHSGYQGHVWVDLWIGGQGLSSSGTLACEDTVTDIHTIIENPASNYAVAAGPVFNGLCAQQFGETVVTP